MVRKILGVEGLGLGVEGLGFGVVKNNGQDHDDKTDDHGNRSEADTPSDNGSGFRV